MDHHTFLIATICKFTGESEGDREEGERERERGGGRVCVLTLIIFFPPVARCIT